MNHLFNKINLYWTCQLLGWGSAAVYWSYHQVYGDYPVWLGVASVVWTFLIGLGSTHVYGKIAHRLGWIHLNLGRLVPRLLLALVALTCCYMLGGAISVALNMYKMNLNVFLGMLTGGIRYMTIWLLAYHLYHFARLTRQAEIDQREYEKLAIAAQLNHLNAELNPHFLFNALNSIKALTLEDPHAARKALDLLSDLLRSALHFSNKQLVPLSEELKRIKTYLALEKIRFEERLQFHFDIQPKTLDQLIPPLSLYNLVENAVKHGVSPAQLGGMVRVTSEIKNGELCLSVVNDGVLGGKSEEGIGLKNIEKRLQLAYGKKARLELKMVNGKQQVAAKVSIPIAI